MKRNFILSFIFLSAFIAAHPQQQNGSRIDLLQKIIPPSPTAAALGKYGDIPVGLYTGTPQIGIPLYTLKEGDIQVPISLSYYTGGVKVSEIASNVGLQWSLNAGGVITRSVRGFPDDGSKGYFDRDVNIAPLTIPISSTMSDSQYLSLEILAYNRVDVEPDLFVYNFNGRSGKFFFDHNKNIHMVSPEDLKIEVNNVLSSWKITDEAGTQYTFSAIETTTSSNISDPNDVPQSFTSSWYLTNITSKNGRQVNFYYTPHYIVQGQLATETDYYSTSPQVINDDCYTCPLRNGISNMRTYLKQDIFSVRLASIQSASASINFISADSARKDLAGDSAIERINVWSNETHRYIKKFHLTYDYFQGNGQYSYHNPWILDQTAQNRRIKLVSVEEISSDSTQMVMPLVHRFLYDESPLPPTNSFAQDHWGFYNGADGNTTMLPKTSNLPYGIAWGNRNSNGAYSSAGTLNKIIYPTGGSTSFMYEPNTNYTQQTTRSDLVQEVYSVNQPGGTETSQSFLIEEAQDCVFTYDIVLGNYPLGDISPQLIIKDAANHVIVNQTLSNGNLTIIRRLVPQTYTMTLISPDMPTSYLHFRVDYKSGPITQYVTQAVGGIRIKQLTDSSGGVSIVKKFIYPIHSILIGPQSNDDYLFDNKVRAPFICDNSQNPATQPEMEYKCTYYGRSSACHSSMGSISGGHIAYDTVTVLYGANGENGKSIHLFNFEYPLGGVGFPYPPAMNYEDRNGLELMARDYNAAGVLLKETANTYAFDEKYRESSVKAGFLYDDPQSDAHLNGNGRYHDIITYTPFQVLSENAKKTSATEKLFSQDGSGSLSGLTKYYYDNGAYIQPTRQQRLDSKGDTLTEYTRYPLDYIVTSAATGPSLAIYNLQQKHLVTAPVEKYTVKKFPSGVEYVISGTFITYKQDRLLPEKIYTLDISQPIPLGLFSPSNIDGANNLQKDSRYVERINFQQYDVYGNLLSQFKTGDLQQSYLWDYQYNYPIAEVMNADTGSIAYSSFESNGSGRWDIASTLRDTLNAVTGMKCYNLVNGACSRSGLASANSYIVSYWSKTKSNFSVTGSMSLKQGKTINGWTYFEHRVTGVTLVTISGVGQIDELRLYPANAQMTTYTYQPLVGMTSQCDVASKIIYYEYDGLQRLLRIRDMDGNIVKQYEYQYQAAISCGSNCSILAMTTLAGTGTIGYPVGVFNANGKLLGNATNQSQYISLWNADTANAHRGTLAAGADPLHFQFTLIPGKTIPSITGCRYFQIDIAWSNINAIRSCNGTYVDFGDGTGMRLAPKVTDSLAVLAPNTTQSQAAHPEWNGYTWYYVHTYPDNSLKTLTFYHNDLSEISGLDNNGSPATSLPHVRNLRGNLPQYTDNLGGSCYQDSSISTVAGITNWSTIHSIKSWGHGSGDAGVTPSLHLGYPQDFMAGNRDLEAIGLCYPNYIGCFDSTFRISRLKSDWNTYFTHLKSFFISDAHWNREDLSGLKELNSIFILP
ncbi:MAG: hypothetical protein J0H74_33785, partial [Chitinophagaceae bacterium]|nr:hypothetical protein [Chitinophagaceae bacterium]